MFINFVGKISDVASQLMFMKGVYVDFMCLFNALFALKVLNGYN